LAQNEHLVRIFEQTGALQTGHFLLASGKHSDRYLEKFNLLRRPADTEVVCRGFVAHFRESGAELVAGPTTGGIILAFEVGRQMGLPAAYAERVSDGSSAREFRRNTTIAPGTKVLLVDDILTTGGSVRETIAALEAVGAEIVGIGVLADRSNGAVTFGRYPLHSLLSLQVDAWYPADCPLCAKGIPLIKPGTTKPGTGL
jgi:orotate phosphoribosyltransferase